MSLPALASAGSEGLLARCLLTRTIAPRLGGGQVRWGIAFVRIVFRVFEKAGVCNRSATRVAHGHSRSHAALYLRLRGPLAQLGGAAFARRRSGVRLPCGPPAICR